MVHNILWQRNDGNLCWHIYHFAVWNGVASITVDEDITTL